MNNKNEKKHRIGRKLDKITKEILEKVEQLSGKGFILTQIADYFEVSHTLFKDRLAEFPELRIAYNRGKPKKIEYVVGKLFENIDNNKEASIFFYLKNQAGWREIEPLKDELNKPEQIDIEYKPVDDLDASKKYEEIMRGE